MAKSTPSTLFKSTSAAPMSPFAPISSPNISDIAMNRNPPPIVPVRPTGTTDSGGESTGTTGSSGGPNVPPQWLNPDGSFKTPDQIASDVGSTLKSANGNGAPDIGKITRDSINGGGTTVDAQTLARKIDNTRNDIASGETDPYKVASQSGIQYTPAELKAIESAYSGVYDPALDSALAKVNQKQQQDLQKSAPYTLGINETRFDGNGNTIASGPSTVNQGTYSPGQNPTVDSYVKNIQQGVGGMTLASVPDLYKGLVAQGLSAQANNPSAPISPTSVAALGIINQLTADPSIDKLSGTGFIGGLEHPSTLFPGTEVQNTQNLAKQLQSTISLANRTQLKGQGAISDFEFKVLGDAATALGLDSSGRTNLSPAQFKDQLQKLQVRLKVGPTRTITDDEVQHLTSKGYTPEQIRAYDTSQANQSFSSVGNTTASTKNEMNIPQRNNNPGNVKAGGLADSLATGKDEYGHLVFKNPEDGFKALTADLTAKINGNSSHLPANPTLAQLATVYAQDPNWGKNVAAILKVPLSTPAGSIPIKDLTQAIARQEGFYA